MIFHNYLPFSLLLSTGDFILWLRDVSFVPKQYNREAYYHILDNTLAMLARRGESCVGGSCGHSWLLVPRLTGDAASFSGFTTLLSQNKLGVQWECVAFEWGTLSSLQTFI